MSVITHFFFLLFRCVPESVRWLQSQNRTIDMFKVLNKVAKSNGKTLSPQIKASLILSSTKNGKVLETVINYILSKICYISCIVTVTSSFT